MIIATDKRDDNLEVDEIISRHVRVASLYSFGIKRLAKQWTSPNYIHLFLIDEFSYVVGSKAMLITDACLHLYE